MNSPMRIVLLAVAMCGLAGCSSPAVRIRENPELFARLASAEQELIRQGRVGIGFDAAMVRLAMGEPDRKWVRTDADGTSEVWSYTTWERANGASSYQGAYPGWYGWPAYDVSPPARRGHEFCKVIFKAGKVISVEQETR